MRPVDALLSEYGESHQNRTNKRIHWVCVPAIFFSTVGLMFSIPAGPLAAVLQGVDPAVSTWATVGLLLTTIWYFRLSVSLGLGMVVVSVAMVAGCVFVAEWVPFPLWQTSLAVFSVAWVFQFIGHKIEGKKPSFLKDIQFLLVGPMWLMHFVYKRIGLRY